MGECEHKWHFYKESIDGCFCVRGCRGRLGRGKAEAMLNEHASLTEKVESYKNVLNAKGEVILANYWIDDEFRQTLHDCIDAQEDGEWITLIRYRPALLESER